MNRAKAFLLAALASAFLVLYASTHENNPSPSVRAIGNVGGVSVAIPREYIFFPIVYEGEDIWSGKRLWGNPTPETPIGQISLLVKLPDMQPDSSIDGKEKAAVFRWEDKPEWLDVRIETHYGDENPWAKAVAIRIKDHVSSDRYVGWKYEVSGKRYGLTEELLVGGIESRRKDRWLQDENLMYDEDVWSTYIQCNTNELKFKMKRRCTQSFSLKPKVNAFVKVEYDASHLKDWKLIQERVSALVYSFTISEKKFK